MVKFINVRLAILLGLFAGPYLLDYGPIYEVYASKPAVSQSMGQVSRETMAETRALKQITLNLHKAPLAETVLGIAKTYHLNVVGTDTLEGTVSGYFQAQDGEDLLKQLGALKGFAVEKQGNLYCLEGPKSGEKTEERRLLRLHPQTVTPASLQEALSSIVESSHISLVKEQGDVVVFATARERVAIKELMASLDQEPKQVRLETTIVALEKSYAKEIGIDWSWLSLTGHGEDSTHTYGQITFGKAPDGGAYRLFVKPELSAQESQGRATLVARPSITTVNGEEAKILIGDRIPVLEETTSSGEKTTHVRYEDVGIQLDVTPFANEDDVVDANIYAEVSSPTLVSELKAYKISSRRAQTRVRMKPGEVLVIGGLMDNRQGQQYKKIPFLGDLPLLGKLFQHARKTKDSVELVMLVKATVV